MRRISAAAVCILLLMCLCFHAGAAPEASQINLFATVSSDGSGQITANVTLHMDQPSDSLRFPIPLQATGVSLNGSWVRTRTEANARTIDLSRAAGNLVGDLSFTVAYSLPNLVQNNADHLPELRLPLLAGFAYPTKSMEFSITLPGTLTATPRFSSGYHQLDIEQNLSYHVDGTTIQGRSTKELKDHETLEMILPVSDSMFPQTGFQAPNLEYSSMAAFAFAVLALAYWIVFLRGAPSLGKIQASPPAGFSAGELQSILHLRSPDLTMMVFTWAQLGYLQIHQDRQGRVSLHRQMEMGNERSSFEHRCFQKLFGSRQIVDTSGSHYGALRAKVSRTSPNVQSFLEKKSGNIRIFRILASLIGTICGAAIGTALSAGAVLQWPVAIFGGIAGFAAGYAIHPWALCFLNPSKKRLWLGLGLCGLWLLLGLISRQMSLGLWAALSQLTAGFLTAIGGRRTEAGKHAKSQVLGLGRYFRSASRKDIQRICQENPDYFFDMAPYALALGLEQQFSRHFGREPLMPCPYILCRNSERLTAMQWSSTMRQISDAMDTRTPRTAPPKRNHPPRRKPGNNAG